MAQPIPVNGKFLGSKIILFGQIVIFLKNFGQLIQQIFMKCRGRDVASSTTITLLSKIGYNLSSRF